MYVGLSTGVCEVNMKKYFLVIGFILSFSLNVKAVSGYFQYDGGGRIETETGFPDYRTGTVYKFSDLGFGDFRLISIPAAPE